MNTNKSKLISYLHSQKLQILLNKYVSTLMCHGKFWDSSAFRSSSESHRKLLPAVCIGNLGVFQVLVLITAKSIVRRKRD